MLWSMESRRIGHDLTTKQQQQQKRFQSISNAMSHKESVVKTYSFIQSCNLVLFYYTSNLSLLLSSQIVMRTLYSKSYIILLAGFSMTNAILLLKHHKQYQTNNHFNKHWPSQHLKAIYLSNKEKRQMPQFIVELPYI